MKSKIIVIEVSKKDVLEMDYTVIEHLLQEVLLPNIVDYKDSVHILFKGYEQQREEVFETLLIRKWVESLLLSHPEIVYFLEDEMFGLRNILLCISDYSLLRQLNQRDKYSTSQAFMIVNAKIPHLKIYAMLCKLSLISDEEEVTLDIIRKIKPFADRAETI